MWSRTRWTKDWYLAIRWGWLIASIGLVTGSAMTSFDTGEVLGALLVVYNAFLLRVTLTRRRTKLE
jgi:hypothetical protein